MAKKRVEYILQASRFTRSSEVAREIAAFLQANETRCLLVVEVDVKWFAELCAELEMYKTMGRVTVKLI